jgi:hypothetical protein
MFEDVAEAIMRRRFGVRSQEGHMTEFFKTLMGRKFYEGDVPALVNALKRLAIAAEQIAERLQAPEPPKQLGPYGPMEIEIDPAWWEQDEDPELYGRYLLNVPPEAGGPGLSLRGGGRYHVQAYRLATKNDPTYEEGLQAAWNPVWKEEFYAIWTAGGAEGPLTTIEVDGHECIMVITPYG